MAAYVINTDNVSGFLKNLRAEMSLFHSELVDGEQFDVAVICNNGHEQNLDRIVPVPPNMVVCECKNGDRIIQHINCVQLRFSKSKAKDAETEDESEDMPSRLPIGFRISCDADEL